MRNRAQYQRSRKLRSTRRSVRRAADFRVEDEEELDPVFVRNGRKEDMDHMVETLTMFEFGPWEEATTNAGTKLTTTKWVHRVNKDEEVDDFVRCRHVACDLKPRHEGLRDDVFVAAMLPLAVKLALFAYFVRARKAGRNRGEEMKLMFVHV